MQNVNHCVTHDSTESFDDHEINNEWNIYKEAQETISDIWFWFTDSQRFWVAANNKDESHNEESSEILVQMKLSTDDDVE